MQRSHVLQAPVSGSATAARRELDRAEEAAIRAGVHKVTPAMTAAVAAVVGHAEVVRPMLAKVRVEAGSEIRVDYDLGVAGRPVCVRVRHRRRRVSRE